MHEVQGAEVSHAPAACVLKASFFGCVARELYPFITLHDCQALSVAAKEVGVTGWLAAAAAAAAGSISVSTPVSKHQASHSILLLVGLLDASACTRSYLSFPALAEVQCCVCNTLHAAAAAAAAVVGDHRDGDEKLWSVLCVLADLFTGGSFGSAGDVRHGMRNKIAVLIC